MKQSGSSISLLMITHNRFEYTWKSLTQLLRVDIPFSLTIVDNASTDKTRQFLSKIKDRRVDIEYLSEQKSLSTITNAFWQKSMQFDFIGKIDNDTLVSKECFLRLIEVHQVSDRIAAVGGFSFDIYQDWNFEKSKCNIRSLGNGCRVLVQPIIGGCAYLTRPRVIEDVGFIDDNIQMAIIMVEGERRVALSNDKTVIGTDIIKPDSEKTIIHGWTDWQARARQKGYIVCYPFPLQIVEHMDDPQSPHCLLDKDLTCTELAKKNARQRGMEYSRKAINSWVRRDGKYLFTAYVYEGDVGTKVYE